MKNSILLLASLLLMSCGARKVNKSKEVIDEKIKTEITVSDNSKVETNTDLNIKTTETTETNKETQEVTKTKTVEPIDNTKPAIYTDATGVKVDLFNAKLTETETTASGKENAKKESNAVINENTSQTAQNDIQLKGNTESEKHGEKTTKDSERKQYDWTKTIIVIAIILVIVCWFVWFFYFRKPKKALDKIT